MSLAAALPQAALDAATALRRTIRGTVLTGSDPQYDEARRVWNGAVDRHPALVVRPKAIEDVVRAVGTAAEYGLPVSVRGGGHDWAGRAVRAGGLVLDLADLRRVQVDAAAGIADVQGGVRAGDVVAAAHRFGLVPVTGAVKAVGLAGLALGGGYGLLNGRHGLAADNVVGARVVLADGRQVVADAAEEPDLFWALRGGGGNFGVVTGLRYRLHRVDPLLAGLLLYPLDQARTVLRGFREVLAEAPDELTMMSGFFAGPDGAAVLFLLPAWAGDPATGQRWLARLRSLGRPISAQVGPMAYQDVIGIFDRQVVDGRHNEMRTRWLAELPAAAAEVLVAAAERLPTPYSAVVVHHCHGAATRVPVSATAFGLRRDHLLVEVLAAWDPAGGRPDQPRQWARRLSADLAAHALPGGYPNLLGGDEADRALAGYGPNLGRLLAVKRRVDPANVFDAVPSLAVR